MSKPLELEQAPKAREYLFASDFDQTLSFNDSGIILSELLGLPERVFPYAGCCVRPVTNQPGPAGGRTGLSVAA